MPAAPASPLSLSRRAPWTPSVTTTTTQRWSSQLGIAGPGVGATFECRITKTVSYLQCQRFQAAAQDMPAYVVLGIFPDGHGHPREQVVLIKRPERFFRDLRWAACELRGLGGTFFSLTHVREFRLYKVRLKSLLPSPMSNSLPILLTLTTAPVR